jgi:hypothetical protein
MKFKTVYNKHTGKIYEFEYKDNGEIIIISQERYNIDDLIVSMVDSAKIDFESGYVELPNAQKTE